MRDRTYGTARYDAERNSWALALEPHVAMRAKQVFGRIHKKRARELWLMATEENCRDLEWFIDRYPLEISDADLRGLTSRARQFDDRASRAWKIVDGDYEPPAKAVKMALPPREYQCQAAALCHNVGGLMLADDLGLGKTVSGITLLTLEGTLPALVVVPTHLQQHWVDKLAQFTPSLRTYVCKTRTPEPLAEEGEPQPDVVICTYSKVWGWPEHLAGWAKTVIFDECQDLRTGQGSRKYDGCRDVAEAATWRLGLSATPIYNYGIEFWNVFNVIKPDALGSREEFMREWCEHSYNERKSTISDPKAFGSYLRDAGLMLRRTKRDVGRELPPITRVVEEVESDTRALREAEDAASELANIILSRDSSKQERFIAGGQFDMKMRQITGLSKAPYVAEFIRMLVEQNEEPVVVFGWHRDVYEIWRERLKDLMPVMFTGSESAKEKQRSLDAFMGGESKVLLMSLRSGSGVDGLQHVTSSVVIGELDWSPQAIGQCIGRVYRDGQTKPVFAYYPVATDGADPVMIDVLGVKRGQFEPVVNPEGPTDVLKSVDPNHVRRMAEEYLSRRRVRR